MSTDHIDDERNAEVVPLHAKDAGTEIRTVESLEKGGRLDPVQQGFHERHALQCGFCTPGMLLTAWALLQRDPRPSRERIRRELVGNLCRCTGYTKILDAVEEHAAEAAEGTGGHD